LPDRVLPRYPVYVPSKGRYSGARPKTALRLLKDGVPFRVVVEEAERRAYERMVGASRVLVLPFSDLGQGSIPARNWIMDHAIAEGHERHWQLDDNIIEFRRLYRGDRYPCCAGVALRACEDFTDRYENIGISGLNYQMFVPRDTSVPFYLNVHVYSCTLVNNAIPHRWRGRYNEDTDLCLQVLADGWCTVALNVFMANKSPTMRMKGGNTDELYASDGRLAMARALERLWAGTVTTDRRWQRPQHVITDSWRKFVASKEPDQISLTDLYEALGEGLELKLKPGVDLSALPAIDEYGLRLHNTRPAQMPMAEVTS